MIDRCMNKWSFCSTNVSFRKTREKWSEGKQLSNGGKLEARTKLHFDFLSILFSVLLILWLNNDYYVASSSCLFFLLSFCFSASFPTDWSSFIWSWLANWMSHCTDMMNVAVAILRIQSNQLVSSGLIAHSRINNTKASRNNIWYFNFKETWPSFDVHYTTFITTSAFTRKIYSTSTPH